MYPKFERKNIMQVQRVQNYNAAPSFSVFRANCLTMSEDVLKEISKAPAFDTFGKKYNAILSIEPFKSSKDPEKIQLAVTVSNIKEKGILGMLKQLFSSKKVSEGFTLKTHATNEDELIKAVNNRSSNTLFEIMNK